MMKKRIAVLGAGTVGSGVCKLIAENGAHMAQQSGIELEIAHVLVRDTKKNRPGVPQDVVTDDFSVILNDDSVEVVAEAMGGIEPAKTYALAALRAGKTYVTANKELVSKYWEELEQAAAQTGAGLYFEAAVAGAVPVIKAVTDSLNANQIHGIKGIINGTTNYILSKMSNEGLGYDEVLRQAQELGYAEADPTNDVEGYDAQFKLSILASLAFGKRVKVEDIHREGISQIKADDVKIAHDLGFGIKLLAIGKMVGEELQVRVHPTMLPLEHPLCSVNGPFNAVFIDANALGEMMLYGRGAGDLPTASAVVSDVLNAFQVSKHRRYPFVAPGAPTVQVARDWESAYFIHTMAVDTPGVLAKAATILAECGVSIEAVMQKGEREEGKVPVVFVTHRTHESACMKAIERIKQMPEISAVSIIRVEK